MSILQRYKKTGGFFQLIQLIETSSAIKQQKLLEAVSKEDPSWAEGLKSKSLRFEKFCNWSPEDQHHILWNISIQYRAILCQKMPSEKLESLKKYLKPRELRDLEEALENTKTASSSEFLASQGKLFTTIRKLDHDNEISLLNIDPSVAVDPAA